MSPLEDATRLDVAHLGKTLTGDAALLIQAILLLWIASPHFQQPLLAGAVDLSCTFSQPIQSSLWRNGLRISYRV